MFKFKQLDYGLAHKLVISNMDYWENKQTNKTTLMILDWLWGLKEIKHLEILA